MTPDLTSQQIEFLRAESRNGGATYGLPGSNVARGSVYLTPIDFRPLVDAGYFATFDGGATWLLTATGDELVRQLREQRTPPISFFPSKAARLAERQRQREEQLAAEEEARAYARNLHDAMHDGLLERLRDLGLDPDELRAWLAGPS